MEKLNLGPPDLLKTNDKLIYARLTGYGQEGPMAKAAGHDINYAGMSGRPTYDFFQGYHMSWNASLSLTKEKCINSSLC